jgi:hypothetical protein
MRNSLLYAALMIGLCGCGGQDVATLGRIGEKVHVRVTALFGNDPEAMMKAMPLVPPAGAGKKLSVPNDGTDRQ